MLRRGYEASVTREELFSDDEEFDDLSAEPTGSSITKSVIIGKRKLEETKQVSRTFQTIESLDVDSDDEDVLVVDTEEDALLVGSEDESPNSEMVGKKIASEDGAQASKSMVQVGSNEQCQMKWLRTVGLSETGALQCTVSNALDTMSESGKSGKTESVMADTIKGMMNVYLKRRSEIVDLNGIVATPLHVVKKLAMEHDEELHSEVIAFPNGYHRVEIFSGNVRGCGEGVNKRIAAQMAAVDILDRIQLYGGGIKVPLVGFFPGWLISNQVFRDLTELCKAKDLPRPKINTTCVMARTSEDQPGDLNSPPYKAECWVGSDLVTIGESESEIFARREAAKEMYNLLTNCEYKDTPYAIGKCCRRAAELSAAGYRMVMSDCKKKWMLQHRVDKNKRTLEIPEEEAGLDSTIEVEELEKDLDNVDSLGYEMMKKKTIKITLKGNKKLKRGEDKENPPESSTVSRCVSFKQVDNVNDDDDW